MRGRGANEFATANISPLTVVNLGQSMTVKASMLSAISATPEMRFSGAIATGRPDNIFGVTSVASPYLASLSAVHSLEASYARVSDGFRVGVSISATFAPAMVASGMTALRGNIIEMSGALRNTWDGLRGDSVVFGNLAISVLRAPAVELYSAVQAAASVSLARDDRPEMDEEIEEILDDAVDVFESRVAAVDQAFVTIYRGGVAAMESGGPDWQRHSMVSFRELSTHVLHELAPDAKILPNAAPGDLHCGRPTRRARLNYIFGGVAGSAIASFYEADMKAALSMFDLLNDGTHKLANTATPEQIHYLKGRLAGLVSSMLSAGGF